ncbi:MAG: ATP-binding protein [Rhizomicrobium sp.]
MQQVLVNLMRNAIEAMRDSPRRELRLMAALGKSDCVEFRLSDTGPGLSEAVAGRLFQPFVSTKQDGMGVGLSICQKILAAHGGRIWAESRGGGAIFCFAIPALRQDIHEAA